MAEQTVEELVVSMRSDGTEETAGDLEEAGDQFEETAEQSEDSAQTLEENANIWDRAMGIIVTGLAVASAGLLSQVPVIGQVFDSLFAVIEAVAFQMDSVLRPVLQPVSDALFGLADAIFTADGAWGTLIGILGTAVTIISGVLVAIAGLAKAGLISTGVVGTLKVAFGALATAAGIVAGAIGVSVGALAAIVAAIIGVIAIIAILVTDFKGMRTTLLSIGAQLYSDLRQWWLDLKSDTLTIFGNLVSDILQWWRDLKSDTKTIVSDFISDAKQWGKDIINALIEGIKTVAGSIGTVIQSEVTGRIEGTMVGDLLGKAGSTVNMEPRDMVSSPDRSSNTFMVDGRDVTDRTGRFRKGNVQARGRR